MATSSIKSKPKSKSKSTPKARASRANNIKPNTAAGAFTLFGAAVGAGLALIFS